MMLLNQPQRKLPLRDYQTEAIDSATEGWQEFDRVMVVLPTGAGKTAMAGEIIARFAEQKKRVLMLAHTQKLVTQFARETEKNYGVWSTIEMGAQQAEESPLVCATIQTMVNRIRKGKVDPSEFALVIVDEAHRALSATYQELAQAFSHAKFLGLTATPRRGDQKDLMKFFQFKAADVPLNELIDRGFLSKLTIKNIPIKIELTASKKTGDYTDQDCAHAIEPYLESIARHYAEEAKGKCGLIFAPLIATSKKFTEILNKNGVKAEHVDGTMGQDDVNSTIERLERGDIDCISNSMLLTEGVDIRPVNVLMSLRPTRSWPLYVQTVGRATRTYDPKLHGVDGATWPPKDGALILDPLWLCEQHSLLQRPSTLFAADDDEAAEIDAAVKKLQAIGGGGEADILEARKLAQQEREEKLRKKLEALANRKARMVDAMSFFARMHLPNFAEYEPLNEFEARSVKHLTAKQHDWLARNKFDFDSIQNMGQAKKIMECLSQRIKDGKASMAQVKFAESLGFQEKTGRDPFDATFAEMKQWLDKNAPPKPAWMKYRR